MFWYLRRALNGINPLKFSIRKTNPSNIHVPWKTSAKIVHFKFLIFFNVKPLPFRNAHNYAQKLQKLHSIQQKHLNIHPYNLTHYVTYLKTVSFPTSISVTSSYISFCSLHKLIFLFCVYVYFYLLLILSNYVTHWFHNNADFSFFTTFFMPLENEDGKNNVVITTIRMRKVETYGF